MIDITRLNVECRQIPADLFIKILNLLPNLNMIRLSELPSYEDIYESVPDINAINPFLKNNEITKLTIRKISNFKQINLIIDWFPRLQYFALQSLINIDLELALGRTLLKINENKIFHPSILCIFAAEAECDKLEKLKQMIDSKNLLKDSLMLLCKHSHNSDLIQVCGFYYENKTNFHYQNFVVLIMIHGMNIEKNLQKINLSS